MTGAGHGVTEDSGRFASGKGMNRSHLVANRFGGTGFQIAWGKGAYRNTLNLISASDKYNQNVMKKPRQNSNLCHRVPSGKVQPIRPSDLGAVHGQGGDRGSARKAPRAS